MLASRAASVRVERVPLGAASRDESFRLQARGAEPATRTARLPATQRAADARLTRLIEQAGLLHDDGTKTGIPAKQRKRHACNIPRSQRAGEGAGRTHELRASRRECRASRQLAWRGTRLHLSARGPGWFHVGKPRPAQGARRTSESREASHAGSVDRHRRRSACLPQPRVHHQRTSLTIRMTGAYPGRRMASRSASKAVTGKWPTTLAHTEMAR